MNNLEFNKIAFWAVGGLTIDFKIPKKNGIGFLKTPLGNHMSDQDEDWYEQIECEVWGVDGTLSFQTGNVSNNTAKKLASSFEKIIKPRFCFDSIMQVKWCVLFDSNKTIEQLKNARL